jgi:ADP-ribosyl-[dinitrogen reductase] hydrolase
VSVPLPEWTGVAEKRAACLIGGAVGDGFGYAVEFSSTAVIRMRFGRKGMREPQFSREGRLVVSDDTQMTMFTLEGMLRGLGHGGESGEIRRAYLDWLDTQGESLEGFQPVGELAHERVMRARRAPGTTCLSALADGGGGTIEQPINNSKGCGGVMRVAPCGLFPSLRSRPATFRLGAESAALTHGHPSGYLSSAVLAVLVRELLEGAEPEDAARLALVELDGWCGREETVRAVEAALEMAAAGGKDVARLGQGWVGEEALAIGICSALVADDFRETLAIASNHDGDSDSTASIAGQIRGAWQGMSGIPADWIEPLDVLELLLSLVERANAAG